jgi:crotonobetainyl-CoA:carnitine CoA-transferase CaiB-like acyl-CoA transferase
VKDFDELFADPQLRHRGMFQTAAHTTLGHIDSCGFPVKMSDSDLSVVSGCPQLGQDTGPVLKGLLGYDDSKVTQLRESKIVF